MTTKQQPILLILTSYPDRECGIATFSSDLVNALKSCYLNDYEIRVCAIENGNGLGRKRSGRIIKRIVGVGFE